MSWRTCGNVAARDHIAARALDAPFLAVIGSAPMPRLRAWPFCLLVVWVAAWLVAFASPRPPAPVSQQGFDVVVSAASVAAPCPDPLHARVARLDLAEDPDDDPDPPGLPAVTATASTDGGRTGPDHGVLPPRPRMSSAQATGPPRT